MQFPFYFVLYFCQKMYIKPARLCLFSDFLFNTCAAELFAFIFRSFEAGIANANSSFK